MLDGREKCLSLLFFANVPSIDIHRDGAFPPTSEKLAQALVMTSVYDLGTHTVVMGV